MGLAPLVAAVLIGTGAASLSAQAVRQPFATAELVSARDTIAPGAKWLVALRLVADPGWHSYWRNAGDAGSPPTVEWKLPEGFEAGPLLFPEPDLIETPPLAAYGYYEEALFLTEITAPRSLPAGREVRIEGFATWVVCEEECVPGEAMLGRTVFTGSPVEGGRNSAWHSRLRGVFDAIPRPRAEWKVAAHSTDGGYLIRIDPPEGFERSLSEVQFFAGEGGVIEHASPQPVERADGEYRLAIERSAYATESAGRLEGLLISPSGWDPEGEVTAMVVDLPVSPEAAPATAAAAPPPGTPTTPWIPLLMAFAGGILLNLMPCVFPVVSLKVLGLVKTATEERTSVWPHSLAFTVGVVGTFLILGSVLVVARAAGESVAWGFQLQSPGFVVAMAYIIFVLGLVLAGVFEVGLSLTRLGGWALPSRGSAASFGTGVLATVVATPCTAPFMGVAIGYGLTRSALEGLLVFGLLGAGMALPYLILAGWPGLLNRLPKAGGWMEGFKQAMAFPLFATVAWLIWVLGQQTGIDAVLAVLVGLTALGVAGWIVGRWSWAAASARTRAVTRPFAALAFAGAIALGASATGAPGMEAEDGSSGLVWEEYSPERVTELRRAGTPVFVDFTAAWCLSCKWNERVALSASSVEEGFRSRGVALLKADWTSKDPVIARTLESFGRSGVPLYLLYHPDESKPPIVLPAILTPSTVLSALDRLVL